jgi:hypothetical protein
MTTYNVTLYTKLAHTFIVDAADPSAALEDARSQQEKNGLDAADWDEADGYCVHHPDSGVYWWDDEHPVEAEEEEEEE